MSTQPPAEDISAIVSRFQAWAGIQAADVRELTEDEALRTLRYRHLSDISEPVAASKAKPGGAQPAKKRPAARRQKRKQAPLRPAQPPAFHQALAAQVSIIPAASSQVGPAAAARTTAISLRISPAEHTLLRRRATETGLSVSSYLRRCVMEVEELRLQVSRQPVPAQIRAATPLLACCIRFFRQVLFGKTTALSIRA